MTAPSGDRGDPVAQHRAYSPDELGFAVITVSSSRKRLEDDAGGARIAEIVVAAGHRMTSRRLVADEVDAIAREAGECLATDGVDVVVLTGGSGLSPADVTPEAVAPLLEREIPGFGELFRMLSFEQVGAAAMLSRALAGVAAGRVVYVLPGSPKAVALAMERLVLPESGHLLGQARRTR